jgi:threonine/homoserine/homoserine lactone efflux protein
MITPIIFLWAYLLGVASTLPLGPSGMCIVSSFALNGSKKGHAALMGLLFAELLYMGLALVLRWNFVLAPSHSLEFFCTFIFSVFLIVFGFSIFKSSNKTEAQLPSKFKNVFFISAMNPTILIFYLGLIITIEKSFGPQVGLHTLIGLGSIFLIGAMSTLIGLGVIARRKGDFIKNNMVKIKVVLGPLFIIFGIGSFIYSL